MSKVRINDLAREMEVKSRQILDVLAELGLASGKTHSSSLEEDEAAKVRAHIERGTAAKSAAHSSAASRAPQGITPKIDLSHISKPGDVLKAIQAKKKEEEDTRLGRVPRAHGRRCGKGQDSSRRTGPSSTRGQSSGHRCASSRNPGPSGSAQNRSSAASCLGRFRCASSYTGHCLQAARRSCGRQGSGRRCRRASSGSRGRSAPGRRGRQTARHRCRPAATSQGASLHVEQPAAARRPLPLNPWQLPQRLPSKPPLRLLKKQPPRLQPNPQPLLRAPRRVAPRGTRKPRRPPVRCPPAAW